MKTKKSEISTPILTAEQVAERLQTSKEHVLKMARAGKIPGRQIGGKWRFHQEAVDSIFLPKAN